MTADPFDDPYSVLGVAREATAVELAEARRQLAKSLHPDLGGDAAAMQAVNLAYDEAIRRLQVVDEPSPEPEPPVPPRQAYTGVPKSVRYDWPSFTLGVLPAEAFEALLLAGGILGQVLVDDPPYLLEVLFNEPVPCWCRLDMVPDAGATTVSLTVAGIEGDVAPDPEFIRDLWVATLNELSE